MNKSNTHLPTIFFLFFISPFSDAMERTTLKELVNSIYDQAIIDLQKGVTENNYLLVEQTLRLGISPDIENKDGVTPLEHALMQKKENEKIIKKLVESGAKKVLLKAAAKGNVVLTEKILACGVDPNITDDQKSTPLMIAASNGYLYTCKKLLSYNANINLQDRQGATALIIAAFNSDMITCNELIDHGANIMLVTKMKNSALHGACQKGLIKIVKRLINLGAYIEQKTYNGLNPLLIAVNNGHQNIVNYLLSVGANVNCAEDNGFSPLIEACISNNDNTDILKLLLLHKSNIDHKDIGGATALIHAASKGYLNSCIELLKNGANLCADVGGCTALHNLLSLTTGNINKFNDMKKVLALAKFLIEKGINVNQSGNSGVTPLILAMHTGKFELVKLLLDHKADVNNNYIKNVTSLIEVAALAKNNYKEWNTIAKLLIERGVNIDYPNRYKITALMFAIANKNKALAKLLIENNANTTLVDNEGFTALDLARNHGLTEIVELIEKKQTDNVNKK